MFDVVVREFQFEVLGYVSWRSFELHRHMFPDGCGRAGGWCLEVRHLSGGLGQPQCDVSVAKLRAEPLRCLSLKLCLD